MGVSRALRLCAIASLVLLTACTPIKRFGADQSLRFMENNLVGPMLESHDADMACYSGAAVAPLIQSTSGLGADNQQLLTLLYLTAGSCAEQTAFEQELRYLRASRSKQIEEAQDARITQKRYAELAARRQYQSYQNFANYYEKRFDIRIGDSCPAFDKDLDELIYLLGLIQGLQAIQNDINSQNAVGVPKDIAAKTERAMTCLDNEKWWGAPMAARALVWNMLPGSGEGQNPWQVLEQSRQIGERHGVRLAHALYAISATAKNDEQHLRSALRAFGSTQTANSSFTLNESYAQVDAISSSTVMNNADRYWTANAGTRTPIGGLLRFWDEKQQPVDTGIEIDDLL
ncbi:hypothetical protein N5E30_12185 [Pseudomonas chengduensis]|nr:hypothetical protein [Pseudomonas chengduensis]MDH1682336.1 hypothetical protein [Pseudomonas chengduensis]MDH1867969.1 hypothetical protein [Pseudomonas chengduensis]